MEAVGVHVFAGGFSGGVKRVFNVRHQLERHGFGLESAERAWGVPTINGDKWPTKKCDFIYGNPRCTGFSTVNFGCSETAHGPESEPTRDAWEFMEFSLGKAPVAVWESVCGAYTNVGRPLINQFVQMCKEKKYRVAHVLLTGHSFGNCQNRRRYFFVAYRNGLKFNVEAPDIPASLPTLWTTIGHMRDRETAVMNPTDTDYTHNSHVRLTPNELQSLPHLPTGMDLNRLGEYAAHLLPVELQVAWRARLSNEPFSRHSVYRTGWCLPCPVLTSSCGRLIHPKHDRGLTVGELSVIMGWGDRIPVGQNPFAQLAKGVVPSVGEWLARQVKLCLNDHWGDEEWSSTYENGEWVGEDSTGHQEKVIDLRKYYNANVCEPDHPDALYRHRLNVDRRTGNLGETWESFAAKSRRAGGSGGVRLDGSSSSRSILVDEPEEEVLTEVRGG